MEDIVRRCSSRRDAQGNAHSLRQQNKGKHGNGGKGQHRQDKDKSKDKNKDSVECWNCGKRGEEHQGGTTRCEEETRDCCAVSLLDITRDLVLRFLTPDGVKRGTRISRMMEHQRWYRVFRATCVGVSLAIETGSTESGETCCTRNRGRTWCFFIGRDACSSKKIIGEDTSRKEILNWYTDECHAHAVGVRHAQREGSS